MLAPPVRDLGQQTVVQLAVQQQVWLNHDSPKAASQLRQNVAYLRLGHGEECHAGFRNGRDLRSKPCKFMHFGDGSFVEAAATDHEQASFAGWHVVAAL